MFTSDTIRDFFGTFAYAEAKFWVESTDYSPGISDLQELHFPDLFARAILREDITYPCNEDNIVGYLECLDTGFSYQELETMVTNKAKSRLHTLAKIDAPRHPTNCVLLGIHHMIDSL